MKKGGIELEKVERILDAAKRIGIPGCTMEITKGGTVYVYTSDSMIFTWQSKNDQWVDVRKVMR